MRTTVTLDADTEALLRLRMAERHVSMKQALNEAVRAGIGRAPTSAETYRTPTYDLGVPGVALDRALQLADELSDEEMVRKARTGK